MEEWGMEGSGILGLVLLLGFFYVMHRYRSKPVLTQLKVDMAFEIVSEPSESANPTLKATFDGMSGVDTEGARLVRFALFNRGSVRMTPDLQEGDIKISFTKAEQILDARFSEAVNTEVEETPEPRFDGTTLYLPPVTVSANGLLVFNIVLTGDTDGIETEAAFDTQNGLYQLGI